jgi:hypothetical protein
MSGRRVRIIAAAPAAARTAAPPASWKNTAAVGAIMRNPIRDQVSQVGVPFFSMTADPGSCRIVNDPTDPYIVKHYQAPKDAGLHTGKRDTQ